MVLKNPQSVEHEISDNISSLKLQFKYAGSIGFFVTFSCIFPHLLISSYAIIVVILIMRSLFKPFIIFKYSLLKMREK